MGTLPSILGNIELENLVLRGQVGELGDRLKKIYTHTMPSKFKPLFNAMVTPFLIQYGYPTPFSLREKNNNIHIGDLERWVLFMELNHVCYLWEEPQVK